MDIRTVRCTKCLKEWKVNVQDGGPPLAHRPSECCGRRMRQTEWKHFHKSKGLGETVKHGTQGEPKTVVVETEIELSDGTRAKVPVKKLPTRWAEGAERQQTVRTSQRGRSSLGTHVQKKPPSR